MPDRCDRQRLVVTAADCEVVEMLDVDAVARSNITPVMVGVECRRVPRTCGNSQNDVVTAREAFPPPGAGHGGKKQRHCW
jgi:hypothetical protein